MRIHTSVALNTAAAQNTFSLTQRKSREALNAIVYHQICNFCCVR